MPRFKCPFPACSYETDDLTELLAAVMLTIHNNGEHGTGAPQRQFTTERIRRPTLSTGGSSEEWAYFTSRWADYVTATKIEGREQVIQLLE